jgi:hypothetical protein
MTIVQFFRLLRASVADSHISHPASRPESSRAPFDLEQLLLGITERAYSDPLFFDLPTLRPNRVRVFTNIFLAQRASHCLLDHRIAYFALLLAHNNKFAIELDLDFVHVVTLSARAPDPTTRRSYVFAPSLPPHPSASFLNCATTRLAARLTQAFHARQRLSQPCSCLCRFSNHLHPRPVPDFHHASFRSPLDSRFSTRRDDCRDRAPLCADAQFTSVPVSFLLRVTTRLATRSTDAFPPAATTVATASVSFVRFLRSGSSRSAFDSRFLRSIRPSETASFFALVLTARARPLEAFPHDASSLPPSEPPALAQASAKISDSAPDSNANPTNT